MEIWPMSADGSKEAGTTRDQEQQFVEWWRKHREHRGRLRYQLLFGLPLGLLVSLPILVNFLLGRFWYKRADAVGISQFNPWVLIFAVLLISVFKGFLYKRLQWDRYEDRYLEIIRRGG